MSGLPSDFWWLPDSAVIEKLLVGVGNHRMIADDEAIPPLTSWYRSINQKGVPSNRVDYYPIDFIEKWRSLCKNTNVYRTIKIFDSNNEEEIDMGPFLVDIDNEKNLEATHNIAKQVIDYLLTTIGLSLSDIRIFFSGHKGFNIEIRPEAVNIYGSISEKIKLSSNNLDNIIAILRRNNAVQVSTINVVDNRETVIDKIYGDRFGYKLKHPFVRLHDSINAWVGHDGKVVSRKKIEITYQDLYDRPVLEIASESEWQAKF